MEKQARITIVFDLPKEDEAKFDGRGLLMITPLSEADQAALRAVILSQLDFLEVNARNLATLKETLETKTGAAALALVQRMLAPSRAAVAAHNALWEILGRAVFVGGDSYDLGKVDGGPVQ